MKITHIKRLIEFMTCKMLFTLVSSTMRVFWVFKRDCTQSRCNYIKTTFFQEIFFAWTQSPSKLQKSDLSFVTWNINILQITDTTKMETACLDTKAQSQVTSRCRAKIYSQFMSTKIKLSRLQQKRCFSNDLRSLIGCITVRLPTLTVMLISIEANISN